MKKFLIRLTFFLLFIAILLYPLDYIVTQGLKKTRYAGFAEWNDLFDGQINSDIIISGSSLAQLQISPEIIDSKTQCNSYNLGMVGSSFHLQYYRYLAYEKHNKKPKIIIQTIDGRTLEKVSNIYNHEQFLPYLDDKLIGDAALSYNNFNQKHKVIPFYKYVGEYKSVALGIAEFFNIKYFATNKTYKGYFAIEGEGKFIEPINSKKITLKSDKGSIEIFETFLKYCKESGIKLFLIIPPIYGGIDSNITDSDETLEMLKKLGEKYDIPYLDYTFHEMSHQKNLFNDKIHLNKKGSELFSEILTDDLIKKYGLSPCK